MRAPTRSRLLALSVVALAALGASSLRAQAVTSAVLLGQVVDDEEGEPIPGVLVKLDTGAEAVTDAEGVFRLEAEEAGEHLVALLAADCRIEWSEVTLDAERVVEVRFELSPGGTRGREPGAGEERRRSQGTLVTAEEIEAMHARRLTEVIRRVAPNMIGSTTMAGEVARVRARSRSSLAEGGTEPVVVVDGVRAADPSRALHSIDASDVAELEILPGSAAGWTYGSDGAAGVIQVRTRRGSMGVRETPDEECAVPDFPTTGQRRDPGRR